jgi:hypothetical protein
MKILFSFGFVLFASLSVFAAPEQTQVLGKVWKHNGRDTLSQNWFDSSSFGYIQVVLQDLQIVPATFTQTADLGKAKSSALIAPALPTQNCRVGDIQGSLNPATASLVVIRLDGVGCKPLFNASSARNFIGNLTLGFDQVPVDGQSVVQKLILKVQL